jgi:hypothetical protein
VFWSIALVVVPDIVDLADINSPMVNHFVSAPSAASLASAARCPLCSARLHATLRIADTSGEPLSLVDQIEFQPKLSWMLDNLNYQSLILPVRS